MAVTTNIGLVDDIDILQGERVVDMAPQIAMLHPDTTQFTTMLMRVRSRSCFSSIVQWLEDQLFPRLSTLSASITNAAGTMAVASGEGSYFRQYDIVKVTTTGEALAVSAAPSTDTVGITRSIGSVGAASAVSGAELIIIGNAAAQGATLGVRKVTERVAQYNYTQIFRHPYGFTNTLQASRLYGQDSPREYERRKKSIEHKRALEYSLFLGARDLDTSGSEPRGFMGGISEFLTTNTHDAGGAMTKAELDQFLTTDLQYSSDNVVLFMSPTAARVISAYAADNWVQASPENTKWGVKIDSYISGAYGFAVPTVVKRDWHDFAQANPFGLGGTIWTIDMDHVSLRTLRATRLLLDRQANDADEVTDEFLTEVSFQMTQERHFGKIYNITS